MKAILKRNQVVISAIAIMLIAAGYMNYTANTKNTLATASVIDTEQYGQLGDATLVSANVSVNESTNESTNVSINANTNASENANSENKIEEQENNEEANQVDSQINTQEEILNDVQNKEFSTEAVQTSAKESNQYFTESRLSREKMYSQMLESYQKILENSTVSDSQKEISQNEIKKINDTKNAIMITENLLKNKDFEDVVIFVNGESISVVVQGKELSQEQIAQIQNIVSREFSSNIENIHISCKS